MKIAGLQKTSLIDYPNKIVSIIFTQGCNFRCPYCHNPGLISLEKPDQEYLPRDFLKEFLVRRRNLIDGISITGGEPTLQNNLISVIQEIKKMDLLVKLDTNGSFPEKIEQLLRDNLVDYIAMDIKAPLEKYGLITRTDNFKKEIMKSINIIINSNIDYEFRTTVVPGYHAETDIKRIGLLIKGAKVFFLQNFQSRNTFDQGLMSLSGFPPDTLNSYKKIIKPFVKDVYIRN